ncbi:hypothetical protein PSC71_13845 [Devosia sp. J2-20]|jgi:hypothetical protein|uniref:THAP4-like heme-binding beta-barrel domain-containing protein n=1 Tax=Devosia litorisediminis TaxID=2829817 RepID=A0A942E6Y2_9HYPH|nr:MULTISPECIES: hypothetical protein [Devosia]MBS3848651.1 hypothetical protein [Devosia litorisediminis]MCZ4346334.1 hypothetical protein [Devosia neptuniae]WDQ98302.1 hypothetical protein PSC71_13845 [Devosia sp. J2-20]|tara:strand:- start:5806 stop:6327 length:522 start_codon:yes stop_codon:yes gene_type:complete
MKCFGRLARGAALTGLLVMGGAAPAFAGPAEVALLQTYIGEWRGRGTLTGANVETVVCRLSLKQGNQDKVNYSGRCSLAGTQLTVAGTMAYIAASKRYEAVMSSNATFRGVAVGQKRGSNLIFNLQERDEDEDGKELAISAQINLQSDAIKVVFDVIYVENGDSLRAEVPFTK